MQETFEFFGWRMRPERKRRIWPSGWKPQKRNRRLFGWVRGREIWADAEVECRGVAERWDALDSFIRKLPWWCGEEDRKIP